jgi:hypothetical protein
MDWLDVAWHVLAAPVAKTAHHLEDVFYFCDVPFLFL